MDQQALILFMVEYLKWMMWLDIHAENSGHTTYIS